MDYLPSSKAPARWAVDNQVKSSDRIILIHAINKTQLAPAVGADTDLAVMERELEWIHQSRIRRMNERARHADREDSIWQTVYVPDIDHIPQDYQQVATHFDERNACVLD
ncbi:hypothetical protein E2562_019558 [Oryza meyeriana var. granulata]|uniref:Uncharacterized protein n=1 Tax=Oryza meyeriana var. granulata TaxID=110450 RepID=A0A6G1BY76_9ORYZ|nr:hypothetical protein E2562_019558 [Oryza meyeriana var. granulata]